jgi:hypothetical protein
MHEVATDTLKNPASKGHPPSENHSKIVLPDSSAFG